jgi:hypothetical protein
LSTKKATSSRLFPELIIPFESFKYGERDLRFL